MTDLVLISYPDEAAGFAARTELVKMQKEYLIDMEDAVVVTKAADGKIQLHQSVNLAGIGAVSGGMWGALIGLLFLSPLLGAAVGAGAGALSGKLTDLGIDDNFLKEAGSSLKPGGSILGILIRKMTTDKVLEGLKSLPVKGKVIQTSLSDNVETELKAAIEAPAAAAS